jgi:hypothetical protein
MRKSGLKLLVADLMISGKALRAPATAAHERHRDSITDTPLGDIATDRLDDSRQLVPRNVGQLDIGIVALPPVPIAQTNATRHDFQHDCIRTRNRVR